MIQTILAIAIIICAVYYLVRKKKPDCKEKGCEGCKLKDGCNKKQ